MTSENKQTFNTALEMIFDSMSSNIHNELFWQTEMQDIGFGITCDIIEGSKNLKSLLTMYFLQITGVDRAIRLQYFTDEIAAIHISTNNFAKYIVYRMLSHYKDNVHISMLKPIINDFLSRHNVDILETKYNQSLQIIKGISTKTLISFKLLQEITFENREAKFDEIYELDSEMAQTLFCKTK